MHKRLAAAASLAAAFGLFALAAAAAPTQDARSGNRARPAPSTELPPAPDLPPAVPTPTPDTSGGMGVGEGRLPGGGIGLGSGRGYSSGPSRRDPSDYETPFQPREVSRKAAITFKPEPGFTREARERATFGLVRLRAVLRKDGEARNISVIKGLPDGLTEKAISAARGIKFRPAQKDGRAVSQWVILEYNFNLGDEEGLDRKAVIHERPAPVYTEEERRLGVKGRAVVEVALWSDGTVGARAVEAGSQLLGERAVEAARKIRFTPAEHDGRKVSVVRRVEYRFPPG